MKRQIDRYQVALKAIVRNADGLVLGLMGKKGGTYDGYFDMPGGRIEVTEFTTPFADILAREIAEECGAVEFELEEGPVALGRHVIPSEKNDGNGDIHILYVFFEARLSGGDIATSDEHEGMKWIDVASVDLAKHFKSGILEGMSTYVRKLNVREE